MPTCPKSGSFSAQLCQISLKYTKYSCENLSLLREKISHFCAHRYLSNKPRRRQRKVPCTAAALMHRTERENMQYLISFLEGIITFISPCLLPMLPVYVSYFAGGGERSAMQTLKAALGFVTGFTLMFMTMGALAGTIGGFLKAHQTAVNIISGLVVVFFGLNFLGIIKLNLFRGGGRSVNTTNMGFFSALVFGVVFSVGWTPCVGAFLGSALMLASQQGQALIGMLMLLAYSLGLGIPFVLSALLIDYLKSAFDWIKRNYGVINNVCGCALVLIGLLMATGLLGRLLAILS